MVYKLHWERKGGLLIFGSILTQNLLSGVAMQMLQIHQNLPSEHPLISIR